MTDATRNLLEQHFDNAFAAPDGVAKLRELILTLAMQGKLVEQDANDPPASELLKEIEAEKQRLVKAGKIKKPKPLPPIKPEEVPYELPQGWEWMRIRDICHDWGQKTPDVMFTYIDVGAIDNKLGKISYNTQILDASDAPSRARKIVKPGTVIYSTVRPYLLNIAIIEKKYDPEPIASTAFAILHPFVSLSARFIYHYLRSPAFIRYVESTQKGVAYPAINDGDFFSGLFPLPPLPEQHRIVARIDQLMARCDELEKLRQEREEKRLAVHAAAIKQLLDAPDGSAWNFLEQHFGELYTVKENVAELRKAILQLAVMGRLVPQNPNDPPASELLKEIEKEKISHEGTKTRRKEKKLPAIKPEEVPYELPQGWEWVRLGDISLSSDSGWSPNCLPEQRSHGRWGVLKVSAVSWGKFNPDENKALPSDKAPRPECEVKPGDFLLSRANTDDLVARSVVVDKTPEKLMMSDKIVRFQLSSQTNRYFINLVNGTDYSRIYYVANASGTSSSMKNVSRKVISDLPIPLPPLPEQHRIVARIDQLMSLCDALEQQLAAATGKQTEILNAVMAQV